MKKRLIGRIVIGLAGVVVVVLIARSFQPSPVMVESSEASRGPIQVTIDGEGKTRVHDRFVIAAPVDGRLRRIALHRGDHVKEGEKVALIEPLPMPLLDPRQLAESRARIAAAERLQSEADAVVNGIRADCEQARREYNRAERLVESGDIAKQEFERIRKAEEVCRQQLQAAEFKARAAASEVEVAKAALLSVGQAGQSGTEAVAVRAPVKGKVLRVLEESERVVSAGTPLLELSGPSLELVIDLLSVDAVKVSPGTRVIIEDWGGDRPLEARVRLVEPSAFTKVSALGIEEQRVNVIADFIGGSGSLGDGYRVEARIVVWKGDDVLKIPSSALFRHGSEWSVFVIEDGKARRRGVEIGHRTPFEVEVLRGLEPDTRIILHPTNQIEDGIKVVSVSP